MLMMPVMPLKLNGKSIVIEFKNQTYIRCMYVDGSNKAYSISMFCLKIRSVIALCLWPTLANTRTECNYQFAINVFSFCSFNLAFVHLFTGDIHSSNPNALHQVRTAFSNVLVFTSVLQLLILIANNEILFVLYLSIDLNLYCVT